MPECGRMINNLVQRLRSPNSYGILNTDPMSNLAERTMVEAADRIEALEAALRLIAGTGDHHAGATMAVYASRALEGK